jgi:hypothetical protein
VVTRGFAHDGEAQNTMSDSLEYQRLDTRNRPYFLIMAGSISIVGSIALLAGTTIAPFLVPDYDWMRDTISDLAAGDSEMIMDVALYGFGGGILALALGAAHAHLGGIGWSAGTVGLACLTVLVIVIGARDEYGDADSGGLVIHAYLVYLLGLAYAVVAFGMADGASKEIGWARPALIGLGLLWCLASPAFFFLPTDIDGLYERGLGAIAVAINTVLAVVFISRGQPLSEREPT